MTDAQRVPRDFFERAILIDCSALYAMQDQRDAHHGDAVTCLTQVQVSGFPVFLSTGTIYETHRLTLFKLGVGVALRFLESVYDGSVNIERIREEDERDARQLLRRFSDQEISYADAINFAIMKRMGIRKAFAFDWHYRLLGFVTVPPLL